jgi:hypothetical protein
MKSHYSGYLEIVEHSHSEPNRFRGISGGELVDERNIFDYARMIPGAPI